MLIEKGLHLKVKFTKIGNRIKWELPVKMVCKDGDVELPHSSTLDADDGLIKVWLGKNPMDLFKKSDTIFKKVNLSQIYDKCDIPKGRH